MSGLWARAAFAAPEAAPPQANPVLSASDRDRFVQATHLFQSGDVASAYETAKPLFGAYPDNVDIQDLRCQLATLRWLDKDALLAECAASTRLAALASSSPAPAAPAETPPSNAQAAAQPAPPAPEPASPPATIPASAPAPPPPRFIVVSAGLGVSSPTQDTSGIGTGFYAAGEYVLRTASWFMPKAYAGLLLTSANTTSCDGGAAPCDVSAKIGFVGAKIRLLAPIPYVAPFIEGGVGLSFGVLTTRTPAADNAPVNFTYHFPIVLGLALGKDPSFELALGYLVHPAAHQVDGAYSLSLSFPLH